MHIGQAYSNIGGACCRCIVGVVVYGNARVTDLQLWLSTQWESKREESTATKHRRHIDIKVLIIDVTKRRLPDCRVVDPLSFIVELIVRRTQRAKILVKSNFG